MPNCRTNLLGIKLVYCDGGGVQHEVWVDLKKVHALSWCNEEVAAKGQGQGGNNKLPTDPNGPGKCPPVGVEDEAVCWWNGTEWICGEED